MHYPETTYRLPKNYPCILFCISQDFKEFLMALDVTHCRSEKEKLQWAFRLYDVDDSGSINLKEITAIMETLDQVRKVTQPLSEV